MSTYRILGRYNDRPTAPPILLGYAFQSVGDARDVARREIGRPITGALRPCDIVTVVNDDTGAVVFTARRSPKLGIWRP